MTRSIRRQLPLTTNVQPVGDFAHVLELIDEAADERERAGLVLAIPTRFLAAQLVTSWISAAVDLDLWPDEWPGYIDLIDIGLDIAQNRPALPTDLPVLLVSEPSTGRVLASAYLRDEQRVHELHSLNRGRPQADGGSWLELDQPITAGWLLTLPADAEGPDLVWGPQ